MEYPTPRGKSPGGGAAVARWPPYVPRDAVEPPAVADYARRVNRFDTPPVVGERLLNLPQGLPVLPDVQRGDDDDIPGLEEIDVGPGELPVARAGGVAHHDDVKVPLKLPEETAGVMARHLIGGQQHRVAAHPADDAVGMAKRL